jgi:peroxiredoxin Q/BCP
MTPRSWCPLGIAFTLASSGLAAQQLAPAPGDSAPDFTLPAATRDGVQPAPVSLRDFRGQTVVLAFFYKARTKG